jgi:hypothetical protein
MLLSLRKQPLRFQVAMFRLVDPRVSMGWPVVLLSLGEVGVDGEKGEESLAVAEEVDEPPCMGRIMSISR